MSGLEPFVLLRLAAGLVAFGLFASAARVAMRVLRFHDVARATEGQLSLERQAELAASLARVGAVAQVGALVLSLIAADRLVPVVKGAMCAYGVVRSAGGGASLAASAVAALVAGVVVQLFSLDARVRGLDLLRALARLELGLAALSCVDLGLAWSWLTRLDTSVVASCCSTTIDRAARAQGYLGGPRVAVTAAALVLVVCAIAFAAHAARRPTRANASIAGCASVAALPFAVAATALEVAPHVYESPAHLCPFCLLRADAFGIGWALFAALGAAAIFGGGALASASLARGERVHAAFVPFARGALARGALAWLVALVAGVAPVVRYLFVARGASLFP